MLFTLTILPKPLTQIVQIIIDYQCYFVQAVAYIYELPAIIMNTSQIQPYDSSDIDDPIINETYKSLKLSHNAEFDLSFNFDFSSFELFRLYKNYSIGQVIRIQNEGIECYITFTQVSYQLPSASKFPKAPTEEFQIWGIVFLRNNFGHILIKPETILDKIHELINPIELDFEDDKHFSDKFYVVTNDELKAKLQMTPLFRNIITNIKVKEFVIEIIDNKLIFGDKKYAQSVTALEFVNLFDSIAKAKL